MSKRNYTPIQIIGTQRSGSNLLRLMLNELPELVAPHPPHILKTFMPLLPQYPDSSKKGNFRQLIEDVCQLVETNPVVWEHVILDRDKIFNACKKNDLIEIFHVVYELMAEANHATHWCCKSMTNVKYADEMEAHHIKPFYIHLVRDGRDVAASFKKVAVGEKHIYHLAKNWHALQKLSAAWTAKIGSGRAITIRYEDLIHHPEKTMKKTCEFLCLNYSPKILKYFNSEESKHTAESGFMWGNLTKPIIKNNTQKYKQVLSIEEIELFDWLAGDMLKKYGYDVAQKPKEIDLNPTVLARFELENTRLKNEIMLKDHLKIDLSKRQKQEAYIEMVKQRLIKDNVEYA